ncbi:hypothetical protein [Streptomyces sp. NPDC090053]
MTTDPRKISAVARRRPGGVANLKEQVDMDQDIAHTVTVEVSA